MFARMSVVGEETMFQRKKCNDSFALGFLLFVTTKGEQEISHRKKHDDSLALGFFYLSHDIV